MYGIDHNFFPSSSFTLPIVGRQFVKLLLLQEWVAGAYMPRARVLIDGASLGPDALKSLGKAFDNAWAEIAGQFQGSTQREAARLNLATAILSVASDDSRDAEVLKHAGLQAMARNYASLPISKDKVPK